MPIVSRCEADIYEACRPHAVPWWWWWRRHLRSQSPKLGVHSNSWGGGRGWAVVLLSSSPPTAEYESTHNTRTHTHTHKHTHTHTNIHPPTHPSTQTQTEKGTHTHTHTHTKHTHTHTHHTHTRIPLLFAEVKLVHSFQRQCVGEIVLVHFKILLHYFAWWQQICLLKNPLKPPRKFLEIVGASILNWGRRALARAVGKVAIVRSFNIKQKNKQNQCQRSGWMQFSMFYHRITDSPQDCSLRYPHCYSYSLLDVSWDRICSSGLII
jgi:hypothetical protein